MMDFSQEAVTQKHNAPLEKRRYRRSLQQAGLQEMGEKGKRQAPTLLLDYQNKHRRNHQILVNCLEEAGRGKLSRNSWENMGMRHQVM